MGKTKRGKGTKIMAVADRHGLPVAVSIASASPHEVTLVGQTLAEMLVSDAPEHLIGDNAYDSNKLDAELAPCGVKVIAPHTAATARTERRMAAPYPIPTAVENRTPILGAGRTRPRGAHFRARRNRALPGECRASRRSGRCALGRSPTRERESRKRGAHYICINAERVLYRQFERREQQLHAAKTSYRY